MNLLKGSFISNIGKVKNTGNKQIKEKNESGLNRSGSRL